MPPQILFYHFDESLHQPMALAQAQGAFGGTPLAEDLSLIRGDPLAAPGERHRFSRMGAHLDGGGVVRQNQYPKGLFIESVLKPDSRLRQCAHNQKCYHELMYIRQYVLEYLQTLRRDA